MRNVENSTSSQPNAKSAPEHLAQGAGDVPDLAAERLPPGKHRDQREAGQQHIGAAFSGLGHPLGEPALEDRPRHDAVLDGKQAEQPKVDEQRRRELHGGGAIERTGYRNIADETYGIEERGEEDGVADDAVRKDRDASEHGLLPGLSRPAR
jgi:hypothetical protein